MFIVKRILENAVRKRKNEISRLEKQINMINTNLINEKDEVNKNMLRRNLQDINRFKKDLNIEIIAIEEFMSKFLNQECLVS